MEQYNEIVTLIAMTLGVGWASGVNLYAAILMLGLLGASGSAQLPPDFQALAHPLVIAAAGLMYCTEFFADKVPGVDTAWDGLHSFIRIPAGALLAAGAVGDVGAGPQIAAAMVGGGMAAGAHAMKSGTRLLANGSPEPFSNVGLSLAEDGMVFAGIWATVFHPWLMLGVSLVIAALMIWLVPKLWRVIRRMFRAVSQRLRGQTLPADIVAPKRRNLPPAQG